MCVCRKRNDNKHKTFLYRVSNTVVCMPEESKHELDSELDSDDSDYNPEADDQIIECIDCLSDHLLDDVMPADMYLGDDDDDEDEEKGEERENFFKQIQAPLQILFAIIYCHFARRQNL